MDSAELVARLQQSRYGDSTAEIFQTCKAAEAFNETFPSARARAQWLKDFGIHRDTWGKLLAVARSQPLNDPEVAARLPASFSTIAILCRLSPQEFQAAQQQGLITPQLSQRRLEAWRREREQQRSPDRLMEVLPLAIAVEPDLDPNQALAIEVAIQEALNKQIFKTRLIFLKGWDHLEEQALWQWRCARLEEAQDALNEQIAPAVITANDLEKPLSQLKADCSALPQEKWDRVYALKNAHGALFSSDSQQRYASRNRWRKAAATDPYARELYEKLIGSNDKSC